MDGLMDVFFGIFHCIVTPRRTVFVLCTSRLSIPKHSNESCFDCIVVVHKDIAFI